MYKAKTRRKLLAFSLIVAAGLLLPVSASAQRGGLFGYGSWTELEPEYNTEFGYGLQGGGFGMFGLGSQSDGYDRTGCGFQGDDLGLYGYGMFGYGLNEGYQGGGTGMFGLRSQGGGYSFFTEQIGSGGNGAFQIGTEPIGQEGPLGSGLFIMAAAGAAYAYSKRKKNNKNTIKQ